MSVTAACILGIVIGACAGVFLMGMLSMSRNVENDERVSRANAVVRHALEEIRSFNEDFEGTQVARQFFDRVQGYRSLVASVEKTLLGYSTNG